VGGPRKSFHSQAYERFLERRLIRARLDARLTRSKWPGDCAVPRHANVRAKYDGGGKLSVLGAIACKGNVVCKMIENTSAETLSGFVEKTVADKVSLIATDEGGGYVDLKYLYHESVQHKKGEYVRGQVHTSNIESFWSLLKRGVIGTYPICRSTSRSSNSGSTIGTMTTSLERR